MRERVCVYVRERERESVCVCVCVRERGGETGCRRRDDVVRLCDGTLVCNDLMPECVYIT